MNPTIPTRTNRGLTIVEVLVSIGIMAVLLVGLVPALTAAAILRRQGDGVSAATSLAQQQMEAVREGWQLANYQLASGGTYVSNTLPAISGLTSSVSTYDFGGFTIPLVNTLLQTTIAVDRAFNWDAATRQFVDVSPATGSPYVPGSQYVVRTSITPLGPQSYCSGSGTKSPCLDPDTLITSEPANYKFNRVSNGLGLPYVPLYPLAACANPSNCLPPIDPNNDVRLFKRVRVMVFRASATGTPLGVAADGTVGAQMQTLRRTSKADTANQAITGPLSVLTTDF